MIKRLFLTAILFSMFLAVGTIGYVVIEGWPPFESFYMTIITLSTVGFGEIKNLSTAGRIFTSFLIFGGIGTACYGFTLLTEAIVSGQLGEALGEKKNRTSVSKLRDHFIVCGFGKIGKKICKLLTLEGKPFVVIENNLDRILEIKDRNYLFVRGDATEKEILEIARIFHAKGLFATLGDESKNVFIGIIAKKLNPYIKVVARNEEETEEIFKASGIDAVVSPTRVGARKMFLYMVRPHVVDFLDEFTLDRAERRDEILIESFRVMRDTTLKDIDLKVIDGTYVLAIKRRNGTVIFEPKDNIKVGKEDVIVIIGREDEIKKIRKEKNGII